MEGSNQGRHGEGEVLAESRLLCCFFRLPSKGNALVKIISNPSSPTESSVSSSAPSVISYIRRPSVSNPPQAPSSTPPDLPRSTSSSKTLLQDALAKAQSAVLLDAANNVTGAISAYSESVRLLRVVMRMVEEKGRREKEKEDARERDGAVGEEERERRRGRREKREKDKEDEARRLRVIVRISLCEIHCNATDLLSLPGKLARYLSR